VEVYLHSPYVEIFLCLIKHRVKFTCTFRNSAVSSKRFLQGEFLPRVRKCVCNGIARRFSSDSVFILRYRFAVALLRN
jgi:hypothetical protein